MLLIHATDTMKLGLYGGSFDPVHLGHLLVARAALEELSLDRLFFIPAALLYLLSSRTLKKDLVAKPI